MNGISQDSLVSSSQELRESKVIKMEVDCSNMQHVSQHGLNLFHANRQHNLMGLERCHEVDIDVDGKLAKAFPWINDFSKLCQQELGLNNINSLENLMTQYIRLVSAAAIDCHKKPNRAAKLKKTMNNTLLLFHLFYSDIKKPLEHSSYLDKMSDLMAMYIDMEITASSRCKETPFKIASKLTSSLFIFLDRSHDHILDSIFKTKYMNKKYWELCNLIFTRVLRESPGRAVCDLTYVRYILAFKMWKRVVKDVKEKRNIMKLATMKLHPPSEFRESVRAGIFSRILPKIPKSKDDITMFLMIAKFCVKEKTKEFLKETCGDKSRHLSSYMSSFDAPFSTSNDTDDSRISSEEDQEENRGSSALINNILTSMSSSDSGVANQIRMANIINKQNKKPISKQTMGSSKKTKCKGIATPVFKQSQSQASTQCDSVDRLRKKRRLEHMSEMTAIKPLPSCSTASGSSNITAVRPRVEQQPQLQDNNVESCQSPSSAVKKEPVDSDSGIDEQTSKNDDKVPSPCSTVSTSSVQVWSTTSCRPQDDKSKGITPAQLKEGLLKVSQSSQTELKQTEVQDPKQEFINKTVEKIEETGRSFHKSLTGRPKTTNSDTSTETNNKAEITQKSVQEKGMLHDQTLTSDYIVFTSQQKFRSKLLNNSLNLEAKVPSPTESNDSCKRCTCVQCSANHTALVTNYKALTQFLKSKRMVVASGSDKIQDQDPSASCLPFKKRRQTVKDKEEEDLGDCKTGRNDQLSYPSTPMISIAMIEPKVQTFVSSHSSSQCLFPPGDQTPDYNTAAPSTSQYPTYDYILSTNNNQQILLQTDPILIQESAAPIIIPDNNILLQSDPQILLSDTNSHILLQSDLNNPQILLQSDVNNQLILQSEHTTYHQVVLQADNQIILQSDLPVASLDQQPVVSTSTNCDQPQFKVPEYKPKFKTPAQLKERPVQKLPEKQNHPSRIPEIKTQKKSKPRAEKVERNLRKRK